MAFFSLAHESDPHPNRTPSSHLHSECASLIYRYWICYQFTENRNSHLRPCMRPLDLGALQSCTSVHVLPHVARGSAYRTILDSTARSGKHILEIPKLCSTCPSRFHHSTTSIICPSCNNPFPSVRPYPGTIFLHFRRPFAGFILFWSNFLCEMRPRRRKFSFSDWGFPRPLTQFGKNFASHCV